MLRRRISLAQIPQLILEDIPQLIVSRSSARVPMIVSSSLVFSLITSMKLFVSALVPLMFVVQSAKPATISDSSNGSSRDSGVMDEVTNRRSYRSKFEGHKPDQIRNPDSTNERL